MVCCFFFSSRSPPLFRIPLSLFHLPLALFEPSLALCAACLSLSALLVRLFLLSRVALILYIHRPMIGSTTVTVCPPPHPLFPLADRAREACAALDTTCFFLFLPPLLGFLSHWTWVWYACGRPLVSVVGTCDRPPLSAQPCGLEPQGGWG